MIDRGSLLSGFLSDRKYRIWRYMFFLLAGAIITSSMVFVAYMDCSTQLGNRIYLLCLSSFVCYAIAMFFNYHYLIPEFLLKGRYTVYAATLLTTAFVLPTLSVLQEYHVRNAWGLPHRITSYTNPLILVDNLSSCMLLLICLLSVSAIVLFRQWKSQEEQLNLMEYEHFRTEINKLKGQVAPSFLSETLINAAASVKTNTQKASDMLMQLGQLLRYQLYDCSRERVILTSEMNQLGNFLQIRRLNNPRFEYEIHSGGSLKNVFISPLLFISLVQQIVEKSNSLKLKFSCEGHTLFFSCAFIPGEGVLDQEMEELKRRLDLQYPGKYTFISEPGMIHLKIDIV